MGQNTSKNYPEISDLTFPPTIPECYFVFNSDLDLAEDVKKFLLVENMKTSIIFADGENIANRILINNIDDIIYSICKKIDNEDTINEINKINTINEINKIVGDINNWILIKSNTELDCIDFCINNNK